MRDILVRLREDAGQLTLATLFQGARSSGLRDRATAASTRVESVCCPCAAAKPIQDSTSASSAGLSGNERPSTECLVATVRRLHSSWHITVNDLQLDVQPPFSSTDEDW